MTRHRFDDEARRRARETRTAAIAGTRPTTRPGSERTSLTVGTRVRVARTTRRRGTWGRYDGREGVVVALNRQRFPSGTTYVEVGVSWNPQRDLVRAAADVWLRVDEVVEVLA